MKLLFALAGNQNSGKTTLFNRLTGSNQHVGNFPGVTVEIGDKTDVTDEDSRFEIENMPSEIHSIVITDKDGSSQTGAFLT